MRVFIDTNVFFDLLWRRESFLADSLKVFDLAVDGKFSAVQARADYLLTRNIKDFGFASTEVLSPTEFLKRFVP